MRSGDRSRSLTALVVLALAVGSLAGTALSGARAAPAEAATPDAFRPLVPTRLLDTRPPGQGGPLGPGQTRNLVVAGVGGVPAGAVAVALNVTVTTPTAASFLSAFPAGRPWPGSSTLNWVPGQTVANLTVVGVGAAGQVSLLNWVGAVHVIVDVTGWFAGGFQPLTPARLLDTRTVAAGPLGWGEARALPVAGRAGIPAGATAVAVNITVVGPTVAGYVSAYPGGSAFPGTSTVNFAAGAVVSNLSLVGLGAGGTLTLYNANGATHVVVDVTGWFSGGFQPLTPARVADTRQGRCGLRLGEGDRRHIAILGEGGVPVSGVNGVALNLTATNPSQATYLTVYPKGAPLPGASSLNLVRGDTVANLVVSGVGGGDGGVTLFNALGSVDIVVDVTGWFDGTAGASRGFQCQVVDAPAGPAPPGRVIPPGAFALGAVAPGRYVAQGGPGCTWRRLGRAGEPLAVGDGPVRAVVDLLGSDGGFASAGCGTWLAYAAPPGTSPVVGDGDWVVSEDLAPGVYQSVGGAPCAWQVLMGFTGRGPDLLDDGLAFGVALVELAPFEVGFRSRGCGGWRWVGPPVP